MAVNPIPKPKRAAPLRACRSCKKKFKPVREWQIFCSPTCRFTHWRDLNHLPLRKKVTELEARVHELEGMRAK